jgi:hypothetical protein
VNICEYGVASKAWTLVDVFHPQVWDVDSQQLSTVICCIQFLNGDGNFYLQKM